MKVQIITALKLSSKMRNRIKHEVRKNNGKNVCALHKLSHLNGYNVYTELHEQHPDKNKTELFNDLFQTGTHYFFGIVEVKRTHQKIFFLADIKQPMYISENNSIFYPGKDETIIIHVKKALWKNVYANKPLTEFLWIYIERLFL